MNICEVASEPTGGAVDVCGLMIAWMLDSNTQYVIMALANTWHVKYCFLKRTPTVRWKTAMTRKQHAVTIAAFVQWATSIVVGCRTAEMASCTRAGSSPVTASIVGEGRRGETGDGRRETEDGRDRTVAPYPLSRVSSKNL